MAELGSYSLILALALGVYAFVAGIVALARKGDAYDRLGETARRAGIAVFGAVALAAVVLVTATFQNDFSISYILHHSNRDLPIPYKFAVLWSGQEGSLLFWALAALHLWTGAQTAAQSRHATGGVRVGGDFRRPGLLLIAGELRGESVCDDDWQSSARWKWTESAAAVSGDGDPSSDALSRLCGIHGPVCVRAGGADHEVSGREVDSHHAALDDGDLGIPHRRHFPGRTLGLLGAGLGRVLGMGSGGERVADAMADGHGVPAFGDDAGKTRHAEGMERVADLLHVHAGDLRHVPDAIGRGQFGARVRAIVDWHLVREFPGADDGGLPVLVPEEPRTPAQRESAGVARLARVEFPVQQPASAGCVFHGAVGNAVSGAVGVGAGNQSYGWPAVL